jgi:hypothetical protein
MPERRFIVRGGLSVLQSLAYAEDVGGLGGVVSQASFRRSYVMSATVAHSIQLLQIASDAGRSSFLAFSRSPFARSFRARYSAFDHKFF